MLKGRLYVGDCFVELDDFEIATNTISQSSLNRRFGKGRLKSARAGLVTCSGPVSFMLEVDEGLGERFSFAPKNVKQVKIPEGAEVPESFMKALLAYGWKWPWEEAEETLGNALGVDTVAIQRAKSQIANSFKFNGADVAKSFVAALDKLGEGRQPSPLLSVEGFQIRYLSEIALESAREAIKTGESDELWVEAGPVVGVWKEESRIFACRDPHHLGLSEPKYKKQAQEVYTRLLLGEFSSDPIR